MSNLGQAVSGDQPADISLPQGAMPDVGQAPTQSPSLSASSPQEQDAASGGGGSGSRLLQILGSVAKVGSTAMAGISDKGRSTFFTGLGEGARSAQAANAQDQELKFRSFSDQVRLAQLHNEDVRMQWADEDH